MENKLKIYGTIGPSCSSVQQLKALLEAGMNGLRLNLSHTTLKDAQIWMDHWQQALRETGKEADLLIDLQGRELRIRDLPDVMLSQQDICFLGDQIPLDAEILSQLHMGDFLLLDDGKIRLSVLECTANQAKCQVLRGGLLTSRKSLKIEGRQLDLPALRAQDLENLQYAGQAGVTGVMVPFVQTADDLKGIRQTLSDLNLPLRIFAKIENLEGAQNIDSLMDWCDEIVIARGDLGNALPLEQLPWLQHELELACRKRNHPYMVVTQMLDSMRTQAAATRAEVNDVFWAVYNGASSIMLTGETAHGKHPVQAMEFFCRTAREALRHQPK